MWNSQAMLFTLAQHATYSGKLSSPLSQVGHIYPSVNYLSWHVTQGVSLWYNASWEGKRKLFIYQNPIILIIIMKKYIYYYVYYFIGCCHCFTKQMRSPLFSSFVPALPWFQSFWQTLIDVQLTSGLALDVCVRASFVLFNTAADAWDQCTLF